MRNPFDDASTIDFELDAITPTQSTFSTTPRSHMHEFKSYRLVGKYDQPWTDDKRLKRTRFNNYIVWLFVLIALCVSGYINWQKTTMVPKHDVSVYRVTREHWVADYKVVLPNPRRKVHYY